MESLNSQGKKILNFLQEYSIPLIVGVVLALIWANLNPESYHHFIHAKVIGSIDIHFLINDIFMVFFFAFATVEIVQSFSPGGALNPIKRAINPLMATAGGVLGPIAVYFLLNNLIGSPEFFKGWAIPTATDIALAWLVARLVFGALHPAVSFLLLLAIADDGIGLIIIALFYPDPTSPVVPIYLLFTVAGMLVSYLLRRAKVSSYWPYIIFGGALSWTGLFLTNVHPALALVAIMPFLPHPTNVDSHEDNPKESHSTLKTFEHQWKTFVDFGLLMFGLVNAGVEFSSMGTVTWIVLASLIVGKTVGIFGFSWLATLIGFPLPKGMNFRELFVAGMVASIGLTVALFVAGVAFTDLDIQGAAKMGALFSVGSVILSITFGKLLGIKKVTGERITEH